MSVQFRLQALVVNHVLELFSMAQTGVAMARLLPEKKVVQLACGDGHFLALTTAGEVFARGQNNYGQLGLGHGSQVQELTQVPLRKDVSGVNHPQFGTFVACGQCHSVVICQNESALSFGMNNCHQCGMGNGGNALVNPTLVNNSQLQITKACCGAMHSLFLSSDGGLLGAGNGQKGQLGQQYRSNHALSTISLPQAFTGRIIDIFAHPMLNVSVILNDAGRYYVSGEAGELLGSKQPIDDFFLLMQRHEVTVSGRLVCMKPETHRYRARYNVPGCCDVQVVGGAAVGQEQPRILYFGWDTIRARSPFLTKDIRSKVEGPQTQQVSIENYSWNAVNAYGRYLHEDDLDAEPETLLELLQLAAEYKDETGLQSLCATVLRRKVTHENLCVCFKKSLKFKFFALAAELLKQGLNLSNACEALNIARDAVRKAVDDAEKTMVVYITNTVMAFAIVHAKAVVQDPKYAELYPEIAKQLLLNLANMELLKT